MNSKLKKSIRRAEALPILRQLKPVSDKILRLQGIKDEVERLKGAPEPTVIFGVNPLSLEFYSQLKGNGNEAYLIALDGETVSDEYSDDLMQAADLIYLKDRQPRFYSMAESRDGVVKSRLLELGFKPQNVKRLGCGTAARIRGVRLADSKDPLLGSVRTKDSELPGYTVFKTDEKANALRILILGGSTSDPTLMNIKSWSEYLFDALKDMGMSAVIYNGAVGGYTSSQEMKKLIRDITVLRPQLIISLSGVNDAAGIYSELKHPLYQREDRAEAEWLVKTGRAQNELQSSVPLTGVSFGPDDERSLFNVWLDNQRIMHCVAEEFGAEFHAFLQPIKDINSVKTDFYRDAKKYFARRHPDWLHDLSRLFDSDRSVFADFCHVYEKGNRIICKQMLRCVLEYNESARCRKQRDYSYLYRFSQLISSNTPWDRSDTRPAQADRR